jgi:hypothetical protein
VPISLLGSDLESNEKSTNNRELVRHCSVVFERSYRPTILEQPASQTVSVGDAAYFTVLAPRYATNGNVQWQRNGTNIPGATRPTIQINNASPADAGEYRALVNTSDSSATIISETATLTVEGTETQPQISVRYIAGSTNRFIIQAFGATNHYFTIHYSPNFTFDTGLLVPPIDYPMPDQPYLKHGLEAPFEPADLDICFVRAVRAGDLRRTCSANLRRIAFAKKAWQILTGREEGSALYEPQVDALFLDGARVRCPLGGAITYNVLGTSPDCTVAGHVAGL